MLCYVISSCASFFINLVLQITRKAQGCFDISTLGTLVTSGQKKDYGSSFLLKIDPYSRGRN